MLANLYDTSGVDEEMEMISKASQIIRREIGIMKDWDYKGSFDDFETPKKLLQLVKWITYGPHNNLEVKREEEAEKASRNLAQHIISSYRSKRQVNYEPRTVDSIFHREKKTPLTVGLALTSYQNNRSRSEIKMLQSMKTAVSYDEVERITTRMASTIINDLKENNRGIHVPPFVKKGIRPLFAIDNIDWGSEAGSFHGADLLVAQKEVTEIPLLSTKLKLDPNFSERSLKQSLEFTYLECDKPNRPRIEHHGYRLYTLKGIGKEYEEVNLIWLMMTSYALSQYVENINLDKQEMDKIGEFEVSFEENQDEDGNDQSLGLVKEAMLKEKAKSHEARREGGDCHASGK